MNTQMRVAGPGAFKVGADKNTLEDLIAALAKEKENYVKPSTEWGRILGFILTVVVSAGCWALIIALLLK